MPRQQIAGNSLKIVIAKAEQLQHHKFERVLIFTNVLNVS